jgi:hypothetical protein
LWLLLCMHQEAKCAPNKRCIYSLLLLLLLLSLLSLLLLLMHAGRRPSLANGGARAAAGTASQAAARGTRSPAHWPFSAKVTLGGETRLVQLTASAGYGDLQAAVAAKFPNAGGCVVFEWCRLVQKLC